jgi:hypothetical protein
MTSHGHYLRVSIVAALLAAMSCSRSADVPRRSGQLPTAPTSLASTTTFSDPAAGRMTGLAVTFPSPQDALSFRAVLEAKFQALGKPQLTTFVNAEGVVVWTLEYLRYRAGGCSQAEAISRVFTQIDRRGVPGLCNEAITGTPEYPPQSEAQAFRQQLEAKYRDDLRAPPTTTYVDQPSEVLYTIEFIRYTQSGCSGASAFERVFVQIDGRGVEPDCQTPPPTVTCSYGISPGTQSAPPSGGSFNATITTQPAECSWRLTADVPWISGPTNAGTGGRSITYSVGANAATQARVGRITLEGSDGTQATLQVNQSGAVVGPPDPNPTTCTYSVSPSTVNAVPEGGTYDIQITAGAGCAWNASSSAAFVTVVSGASGNGNGTARFRVAGNSGDTRQGTAEITFVGGSRSILFSQTAALPQAIISAPLECAVDADCLFDGTLSRGILTSYRWEFGDGNTASTAIFTHVYDPSHTASDYPDFSVDTTVRLTVTGPLGTSTATAVVRVFGQGSEVFSVSVLPAQEQK